MHHEIIAAAWILVGARMAELNFDSPGKAAFGIVGLGIMAFATALGLLP